jgi:hypothetical protein
MDPTLAIATATNLLWIQVGDSINDTAASMGPEFLLQEAHVADFQHGRISTSLMFGPIWLLGRIDYLDTAPYVQVRRAGSATASRATR